MPKPLVKPMSLADELETFFSETDAVVIEHPLSFKAKLGIGEKAYASLRLRENMTTFSEAIGIGAAASGIAASGTVATTFFGGAGSGWLASIGLGTVAATPVGWVIAAGVIAGGAYIGVSKILEAPKDAGVVVVPKYINTPLDVIAVALIEMMLPVSLKIAAADGEICEAERNAIINHFTSEWGYSRGMVEALVTQYAGEVKQVTYSRLMESLTAYCAESPDCDKESIIGGFLVHLREIVEADGVLHEQELADLRYIRDHLINDAKKMGAGKAALNTIKGAAGQLSQSAAGAFV